MQLGHTPQVLIWSYVILQNPRRQYPGSRIKRRWPGTTPHLTTAPAWLQTIKPYELVKGLRINSLYLAPRTCWPARSGQHAMVWGNGCPPPQRWAWRAAPGAGPTLPQQARSVLRASGSASSRSNDSSNWQPGSLLKTSYLLRTTEMKERFLK